jgi:hypothetical protein
VSSSLVDFYAGRETDARGRTIDEIWSMSLDELESTHDFIQWLFPLRERSAVEPRAPILTAATIAAFDTPSMRVRLVRSAEMMAVFYGFQMRRESGVWRVGLAPDAAERQRVWLSRGNHNFLRLTRIMKSLATLGLRELSIAWLDALREVYSQHRDVVGARTWQFWEAAPQAS